MASRTVALAVVCLSIGAGVGVTLVLASLPTTRGPGCGSPTSGSGGPLGAPPFAFGTVTETTLGTHHWYSVTLAAAGAGLELDNLKFHIETQTGRLVTPSQDWTLTAINAGGTWLGAYSLTGLSEGNWTTGGTTTLSSGLLFSLFSGPDRLSGDALVASVLGSGPCPAQGTFTSTTFW